MDSSAPIQGYRTAQEALSRAKQSSALKVHTSDTAAERLVHQSDTSVQGLDALTERAGGGGTGELSGGCPGPG